MRSIFKIIFNQDFAPNKFLTESIDIRTWRLNDLAQDNFNEDNAVLVLNGVRRPLCIDHFADRFQKKFIVAFRKSQREFRTL
jgi:hypothetical protein